VLSARIQQLIAPFAEQVALLDTIPGVDQRAAEVIVAEIGPDMGQFPPRPTSLLGRGVSWQQRVGWHAPLGADPQGPPSGWVAA
jgi:transposase